MCGAGCLSSSQTPVAHVWVGLHFKDTVFCFRQTPLPETEFRFLNVAENGVLALSRPVVKYTGIEFLQ